MYYANSLFRLTKQSLTRKKMPLWLSSQKLFSFKYLFQLYDANTSFITAVTMQKNQFFSDSTYEREKRIVQKRMLSWVKRLLNPNSGNVWRMARRARKNKEKRRTSADSRHAGYLTCRRTCAVCERLSRRLVGITWLVRSWGTM